MLNWPATPAESLMTDYMVLLAGPDAPSAEIIKESFRVVKRLTEADAAKAALHFSGVLMRSLTGPEAEAMQTAFRAHGVPTAVLRLGEWPRLPDAKFVKRLEFQSDALQVFDPLGRPVPVPWSRINFLAAGVVRHVQLGRKIIHESGQPRIGPGKGIWNKPPPVTKSVVLDGCQFILHIVLGAAAMRFEVEGGQFHYRYVFDRPELEPYQKLGLLVRMLAEQAPQAVLNRGARELARDNVKAAEYPHKPLLESELAWQVWRAGPES